MIVDGNGIALNLKRTPRLCLISPKIDLTERTLTLSAVDCEDFVLSLDEVPDPPKGYDGQKLKVCGADVCDTKRFADFVQRS